MHNYRYIISLTFFLSLVDSVFGSCTGCNIYFNTCEVIITNYDECHLADIDILEDIINQNNLDSEFMNLGYQEWSNGRLISIILLNNNINVLPDSFGNLSFLEGLDLEFNFLETLPESFGNLINLKYLDLSSNQIQHLPQSFYNLTNLVTLGLYNNQLTYIQDSIGLLNNLEFINLSFNQLVEIPDQICNLQNLNWSDHWINFNYSYLYNNSICPPYPDCLESHIGYQNTSECSDCNEIIGDINIDGNIDILDIIYIANCILSRNCDECLDLNSDNNIDILDIIFLVNIILT